MTALTNRLQHYNKHRHLINYYWRCTDEAVADYRSDNNRRLTID